MGSSSLFYRDNKASSFEYNNGDKKLPNDIIESINNEKEITSKLKEFLENSKDVDGVIYKDNVVFPFTTFSAYFSYTRIASFTFPSANNAMLSGF